eukprot:gnl/Chilomastix_caulleri/1895.p1 GENE.gnl/Chilomastix_caulleri/1895~~gnl/Chilomastix_caulleri/1895.p1  ORF type:complete len:82 (+),score=11.50 gnl/Chilomastix_caulleri/1895:5-250(+)
MGRRNGTTKNRKRQKPSVELLTDPPRMKKRDHFLRANHLLAIAAVTGQQFFTTTMVKSSNKATIRLSPSIKTISVMGAKYF